MGQKLFALVFILLAAIAIPALCLITSCYKCVDADCSNLPPVQPDYPPTRHIQDAGRDR